MMAEPQITVGPPRYFRPVCIRYSLGFKGGPAGFVEVDGPDYGPLIIEPENEKEPKE